MNYIKKYIHVSVLGTVTGITVSAFTYSAMMSALQNTALGTDLFCGIIGDIFKIGTTYLCGDIAGRSVKLIIKHIGHTSKKTIDTNSHIVAGVTALTAGTLAMATVVIGEYIIYYGIEYGGKITHEVAGFVSESAVKLTNKLALKLHTHEQLISDDWQLIGPMDYEFIDNSVEISTEDAESISLPNLENLINEKIQGENGDERSLFQVQKDGASDGDKDMNNEKNIKDDSPHIDLPIPPHVDLPIPPHVDTTNIPTNTPTNTPVKSEKEFKDNIKPLQTQKQSHNQKKKFRKQPAQSTTLDDSFFPHILE